MIVGSLLSRDKAAHPERRLLDVLMQTLSQYVKASPYPSKVFSKAALWMRGPKRCFRNFVNESMLVF